MANQLPSFFQIMACAILTGGAYAQPTTSWIAPSGFTTVAGNAGNTIPWWSGSSTYQQVHDGADLAAVFPTPVPFIKGLSFRTIDSAAARTLDARIALGITAVTPRTVSTIFANNLGTLPSIVLPYTTINLPALATVSTPNPQGWFFPFTAAFVYPVAAGNLCYELRTKNCYVVTTASFDAVTGANIIVGPMLGTGCLATGQTSRAVIGSRSLILSTGDYVNRLDGGPASAPAMMIIGDTAGHTVIPGVCGALETRPLVTLHGFTNHIGTWNVSLNFGNLFWTPKATVYAQFAFLDPGLPSGLGLSDCSSFSFPSTSASRVFYGPIFTGQGNENAVSGLKSEFAFALITGFET